MMFRSLIVLSAATVASAGFAEDTCPQESWVPLDNTESPTGRVRCCASQYGRDDKYVAACDTSSCPNNFNAKNRNCFNYGAPQNGKNANDNAGSALCPYADSDHAICDTSPYNDINPENCRTNSNGKNYQVHCLGKVKCNTVGVTVPKNGHSDGTADFDNTGNEECSGAMDGFSAGDDCFYNGSSENWKVCEGPADEPEPEPAVEEDPEPEPAVEEDPEPEPAVEEDPEPEPAVEEDPEPEPAVEEDPEPEPQPDEVFTKTSKPGTKGDPHFKTHGGEMYDFHGGCDLVLLDNPEFLNGLGMRIHIRTKIVTWWSHVESAAIQVGDLTVEIQGGNKAEWLHINGVPNKLDLEEGKFYKHQFGDIVVRYYVKEGNGEVHIHYGRDKVWMKTFKDFVKVEILGDEGAHFAGSLGLLGTYPEGNRVARDGKTLIEDVNAFGQEWVVQPDEPELFHASDADWIVPAGQKCRMPIDTAAKQQLRQRRLAAGIPMEKVNMACAHLKDTADHKACVSDVIATQDMSLANGGVW